MLLIKLLLRPVAKLMACSVGLLFVHSSGNEAIDISLLVVCVDNWNTGVSFHSGRKQYVNIEMASLECHLIGRGDVYFSGATASSVGGLGM